MAQYNVNAYYFNCFSNSVSRGFKDLKDFKTSRRFHWYEAYLSMGTISCWNLWARVFSFCSFGDPKSSDQGVVWGQSFQVVVAVWDNLAYSKYKRCIDKLANCSSSGSIFLIVSSEVAGTELESTLLSQCFVVWKTSTDKLLQNSLLLSFHNDLHYFIRAWKIVQKLHKSKMGWRFKYSH